MENRNRDGCYKYRARLDYVLKQMRLNNEEREEKDLVKLKDIF